MITIITVTYNNLEGLKRTASSIISQSFQGFFWVIVDGLSSDGTAQYIDELSVQCSGKILAVSEKDSGLYDAMNKGLRLAPSDGHIIFLNSGDSFYSNDTLLYVYDSVISKKSVKLIAGESVRYSNNAEIKKKPKSIEKLNYGMFCEHQAAFFEAGLAKSTLYDTRYSLSADYDFFIQVTKKIEKDDVSFIDFPVCYFEFGGVSYKKRSEAILEDALIRIRRYDMGFLKSFFVCFIQYWNHRVKKKLGVIR
ncbi:glycosyltransferase [Halomonas stenophila]|uniref:Glycosyltransferase involved in cell wall biosynthesis n=1 Tax=Halomonas stenophila TaxID=795312 RepID=A0A7W5ES31_9GAMM|nr:glycosyltransferase [Halomonas stenophila]MBB3229755.1 glycosyltransferase involved in cell wall biosynthesis [Halomonas stenophila]